MKRIVAGNWKMYETSPQAEALTRAIVAGIAPLPVSDAVEVVIAPPFTALSTVGRIIADTRIVLGAQNMYWKDQGAFTGEISPPMLVALNVGYVILGHSERRHYFGETDTDVNKKTHQALAHGLIPIVAVGETGEERDAGLTDERVTAQTRAALDGIPAERLREIVLAYEPVWAIGTGKSCEPAEADRVMGVIRSSVHGLEQTPILYGGSVTPQNFSAYHACENINGGLVGGASLDATRFTELVRLALGVQA